MKVKTAELIGPALDWAVAQREGKAYGYRYQLVDDCRHFVPYSPSTDWSQGGPIIERERVGVWPSNSIEGMWASRPNYEVYPERLPANYGPTPLIAAMRAFVASELGGEIEIPEELLK